MDNNVKKIYLLIRDIDKNYRDASISADKKRLNSFVDSVLSDINEAIAKFNNLMNECELIQIEIIEMNHPSYATIARKELVILDENSIKYKAIIFNAAVINDAAEKINLD